MGSTQLHLLFEHQATRFLAIGQCGGCSATPVGGSHYFRRSRTTLFCSAGALAIDSPRAWCPYGAPEPCGGLPQVRRDQVPVDVYRHGGREVPQNCLHDLGSAPDASHSEAAVWRRS
jgi:hypothetical protein